MVITSKKQNVILGLLVTRGQMEQENVTESESYLTG